MVDAIRSLREGTTIATIDKKWREAAKKAQRGCMLFSTSTEMIHFVAKRSYIMLAVDDKETATFEVLVKKGKLDDIKVWKVIHMEESA